MEANEQSFPVMMFNIKLHKAVLFFEYVGEILNYEDYSNASYRATSSCVRN